MKSLTEQLKGALSAMAFADTAEMLGPRDKRRVLAGIPLDPAQRAQPRTAPPARTTRQIVLSLGATLQSPVMDYVCGVCQRMDAELVVLCCDPQHAAVLLSAYADKLSAAHIAVSTQVLSGNTAQAVKQYLHSHPQVLFVVSSDADDPVHQFMLAGKHHAAAPVPIVVVSGETRSTKNADAPTLPQRSAVHA
jgi:hypothetical protein